MNASRPQAAAGLDAELPLPNAPGFPNAEASGTGGSIQNSGAKSGIYPGRYTAGNSEEIVVFLIGFRFNGLRGLLPALQTFSKMPGMLAALARKPELGCLGGHVALGGRTAYVIQYWRSYEDLERFAHLPQEEHLPAWRWFNRLGAKGSGAGIWHETFRVAPGAYESIYVNMPRFGLAKATEHRPLARGSSARERISAAGATA